MSYKSTKEQSALSDAMIKYCRENNITPKIIIVPMRDCDDVPRHIEMMNKAHEETKNSTLRFRGIYNLTASLN